MEPLNVSRYAVIKPLVDVFPKRLKGPELVAKSQKSDAVKILKAVARIDSRWAKVIDLPGDRYGYGYGLIHPDK
jgi:hypothetical protein